MIFIEMIKRITQAPICKLCGRPTTVYLVPRTVQLLSDGTLLQKHSYSCSQCGAIRQTMEELVVKGYIEKWDRGESE